MEIQSASIRLRPCETGFILEYEVCIKVRGANGPYSDGMKYERKEETFNPSEAMKATKRLTELYKEAGMEMKDMD